jgi:hypothetical protein
MKACGPRLRISARLLAVPFVCCLVTSCASRLPAHDAGSGPVFGGDTRLSGPWHVASVRIAGQRRLRADSSTTAALQFRRDGRLIVNGERCGAPQFAARNDRIALSWPRSMTCSEGSFGTPRSVRIASVLERIMTHRQIAYAVHGKTTLTVRAGRYRAELLRGRPAGARPDLGPSSPLPYSGSASSVPQPR